MKLSKEQEEELMRQWQAKSSREGGGSGYLQSWFNAVVRLLYKDGMILAAVVLAAPPEIRRTVLEEVRDYVRSTN